MRKVILFCCWLFSFTLSQAQLTIDIGEIDTCTSSAITVDVPIVANQAVDLTALQFTFFWDGSGLSFNSISTSLVPDPTYGPNFGSPQGDTLTVVWSGSNINGLSFEAGDTLFLVNFTVTNPTAGNQYDISQYAGSNSNYPSPLAGGPFLSTLNLAVNPGYVAVADDRPVLNDCPTDIVVDNTTGQCGAIVDFSPPTVVDCDNNTVDSPMASPMPNTFFDVGTTMVTYTVSDQSGNTASCTFNVTVNDAEDPTLSCTPADITITVPQGTASTTVNDPALVPTFDDNCPGESLSHTLSGATSTTSSVSGDANGSTFNLGTTLVTYTVTDASNNTATCSFNVVVEESTPIGDITIDILDVSLQCCPTGPITLPIVIQEAASLTALQFTVQWEGSSLAFNGITSVFNPLFLGPNGGQPLQDTLTVVWSSNSPAGQAVAAGDTLFTLSFDVINCTPGSTYGVGFYAGGNSNYPQPLASGPNFLTLNVGTLNGGLTITSAPLSISCPSPSPLPLDANCEASLDDYSSQATVIDACGTSSTITQTPPAGTTITMDTQVKLVAENNLGERDSCTFTVAVEDVTPPSITCPSNQDLAFDANCMASLPDYTNATTSDNCDTQPTVTQSPAAGTAITSTTTVKLFVQDGAGNRDSCEFMVMVADTTSPSITCPTDMMVTPDNNCQHSLGDFTGSITASDNCDNSLTISQQPPSGTIISSDTVVVLVATDDAGNMDTCRFNVVLDIPSLNIECPADQTVAGNQNCEGSLLDYTASATANGGCGTVSITQMPPSGTSFTGSSIVTLTATDANGTTATCTFQVLVEDVDPPSITCPDDLTLALNASCNLSVPAFSAASISDNCTDANSINIVQTPAAGSSLNGVGTTTIKLVATDLSGNRDSCEFLLTTADSTAPMITCPVDMTVQADNNCQYSMADFTSDATANDNCDNNLNITQQPPAGTLIESDTTVSLIVMDASGNADTCTFQLDLQNDPPSITCPADQTVDPNQDCDAVLDDYTGLATTSDGCGTISISQSPTAGTTISSTTVVTLTATDASGTTATCTFSVSINNNNPPSITCPADQVLNSDQNCEASLADYTSLASTSGGCGAISISQSPTAGTTISSTTVVTLTATDASGTTATCTFSVSINDDDPPSITCPDNTTIALDNNCAATVPAFTPASVSDNCSAPNDITIVQEPAAGTSISGTTPITIKLTATDQNNNNAECSFTLTPVDVTPPSITCPNDTLVDADGVTCTYTLIDFRSRATVSDNCSNAQNIGISQSPAVGTQITGMQIVTLTATDEAGRSSSCTFTVTVDGSISISCPADQTVNLDQNCQFALEDYTNDPQTVVNSPCAPLQSVVQRPLAGTIITSSTLVTLIATDQAGNVDSCNFTVNPVDVSPPVITCPADQTVATDANCLGQVPNFTAMASATDNCDGSNVSITQVSPIAGSFITANSIVTLRATDTQGNSSECTFNLTLVDETDPVVSCPMDVTVGLDSNCEALLDDYTSQASATDNCSLSQNIDIRQNPMPGTIINGSTVVTISAIDEAGNFDQCTFTVTATDQPPVIVCPGNQDAVFDANCAFELIDYRTLAAVSDDCSTNLPVTQTPAAGTMVSGITTITLTVTDDRGQMSSCTFDVIPTDQTGPSVSCPADMAVDLDANCNYSIPDFTAAASSSDNCDSNPSITQTPAAGTLVSGPGSTLVTLTATDNAGNTGTCSFNINHADNTAPVLTCPSDTTLNAPPGSSSVIVNNLDVNVDENCGLDRLVYTLSGATVGSGLNDASGNAFNLGTTLLTYTATDVNGNTSTCTSTIMVNGPFAIICPADTVVDQVAGNCSAIVNDIDLVIIDSLGLVAGFSYTLSGATTGGDIGQASGTLFPVGTTTVTYTATDVDGNQIVCAFTVRVRDTEAPTLTCPSDIAVDNEPGFCGAVISFGLEPTAINDNCRIDSVWYSLTGATTGNGVISANGSNFNAGVTTVTFFAKDADDNVGQCSFTVSVSDEVAPTITCPANRTVDVDSNCLYTIPDFSDSLTATDDCDTSLTIVQRPVAGTVVGTDTDVTLIATDDAGNSDSCTFNIQVRYIAPSIVCPNDTMFVVSSGTSAVINDIAPTVGGSCVNTISYTLSGATTGSGMDDASGTTFNEGQTLVTYTATDGINTVSCSFTVTISTMTILTIDCPMDQVVGTDSGVCSAQVPNIAVTQNLNIANIQSITYELTGVTTGSGTDDASGETFNLGITTVSYTVNSTDGQSESCSFTVTVEDREAPSISCPTITTFTECDQSPLIPILSDNCALGATVHSLSGATTGNGGGFVLVENLNVGLTTLTYEVSDLSGNTNTCSVDIMVTAADALTIDCPLVAGSYDTDAGQCFATINDLDPTFAGGCAPIELTYEMNGATMGSGSGSLSGFTFNTGLTNITYTVTSADGQTTTCSRGLLVVDNENPSIACPADLTVTADTGRTAIVINGIPPIAGSLSDNCGVDGVAYALTGATRGRGINDASGTNFQEGATVVTYTVTDLSGNTADCSFTVTVLPGPIPDLIDCVGNRGLDANDDCVGIPTDIAPIKLTSDANFSSLTYELSGATSGSGVDDASGTRFNLGVTTVTYFATSIFGNQDSCSFTITVTDRQNPVISNCPANISQENDGGQCGAAISWTPPTASDNCQLASFSSNFAPGDFFPVGTTTVTYTAVDNSGNESICQFTVTVADTEAPVLNCPPTNITFTEIGNCRAIINWDPIRATDNCQIQSLTTSANPGDTFPVGITLPIIVVAVDIHGNTTNCDFEITLVDNDPPILVSCVEDVTLDADPLTCGAIYDWEGPTFNDCSTFSIDCTPLQGSNFPIGTTEVVCVATDRFGNSSECRFNVTVRDVDMPTVVCPENVEISAGGSVITDPSNIVESVTVNGNCNDLDIVFRQINATDCSPIQTTIPSGNFQPGSTTNVSYVFTDSSGNVTNCPFDVVIGGLPNLVVSVTDEAPCAGTTIQFMTANAPNTGEFEWTGPDNFQSALTDPIITNIQDEQSGLYTLVYTSPEGCTQTAAIEVQVQGLPQFTATAEMIVCDGVVDLGTQVAAGSPTIMDWIWIGPAGDTVATTDEIQLPDLDAGDSGMYTLVGTTGSGCTANSSIMVQVLNINAPEVELECDGEILCLGDGCTILGTPYNSTDAVIQYNWTAEPAAGAGLPQMTDNNEIFVEPTEPGTYTYSYWVMIDSCTTDTITTILNVGGRPDAVDDSFTLDTNEGLTNFDITENDNLVQSLGVNVTVLERPTRGGLVLNADGTYNYTPQNNFIGTDQFVYRVCYDCGTELCDTATVELIVDYTGDCIIPTLITPNSDNINDLLEILCLDTGDYPDNELIIFNQWGDRVFRAQPYQNTWDGTFNGEPGKDLPDGTYFFIFRQDRNAEPQRGSITIFR